MRNVVVAELYQKEGWVKCNIFTDLLSMYNTYIYTRKVFRYPFMFWSNQFKFLLIWHQIHILPNITKTFYTAQTYFCFCCPMRYDFYTDKRTATQKRKRVCFELKHETGCFRKDCYGRDSFSISRVLFLLILVRRKLDIASVRTSICTLFGGCWKMCILSRNMRVRFFRNVYIPCTFKRRGSCWIVTLL